LKIVAFWLSAEMVTLRLEPFNSYVTCAHIGPGIPDFLSSKDKTIFKVSYSKIS